LADYIAQFNNPGTSGNALLRLLANTLLLFCTVAAYHNIKFTDSSELEIINAIHAWLEQKDLHGQIIPL
jgi:hypothetical protein